MRESFRALMHRWFVLYNPLYIFSALCMLVGAFLVAPGADYTEWQKWKTAISAAIDLYGLLLIGGAAILFRVARQLRPSVMLGLLAAFFLFDPTCQAEVHGTFDRLGGYITGVWFFVAVLKLFALRWAFRLRLPWSVMVVPFLALAGIAVVPHLLYRTEISREAIHLAAVWGGIGLAAFVLCTRPVIRSASPSRGPEQEAVQPLAQAIWLIWAGLYLYHLIAWVYIFHIEIVAPILYLAPVGLLLSLLVRQEKLVWAGCVGTLLITLLQPLWFAPTAFLAGAVFGLQAWRMLRPRLYIGAALSSCLTLSTVGWHAWPFPPLLVWALGLTAVALVAIAARFRLLSALLPFLLGAFPLSTRINAHGMSGWGIALMVTAFVTLVVGVAINWTQRRVESDPDEVKAWPDPPAFR